MFDVYWGSWIRTNEMTESKSVALPLGYTPRIGRDKTRPGSLSYSGVLPPYYQSLRPAGQCSRDALLSWMLG